MSAVLHFTSFPFPFFFSPDSSVAQTLKNVEPLDCKFHLLRRPSLGGKISVSEVIVAFVDFVVVCYCFIMETQQAEASLQGIQVNHKLLPK